MRRQAILCSALAILVLGTGMGCAVLGDHRGPKHVDATQHGNFNTVKLESSDLHAASNMAVGRMIGSGLLQRTGRTPVLLVDDTHFSNASDSAFNTRSLVDLLRNEIVNAANGQVRVISPYLEEDEDAEEPRPLPQHDYVLMGRVTDVVNTEFHRRQSIAEAYTQIALQVVTAETGEVVFSDLYAVKKSGAVTPRLY